MAVLLRFHGGSIAFAAVCIGLVRPFRFVLGTLTAVTRMPQNPFSWMETLSLGWRGFSRFGRFFWEGFEVRADSGNQVK